MSEKAFHCPSCQRADAVLARLHWSVGNDGRRHLHRLEMQCQFCPFQKVKVAVEPPPWPKLPLSG